MPAALYLSGPCEICGQKAFGRNFGVMSCRACAAFFRRAAVSNRKIVACENGSCEVFVDGKYQCKKCRLKRCYDVGMDPSKFQMNRDLISTSSKSMITKPRKPTPPTLSLSVFLGRPCFILTCEPDKASRIKNLIDVDFLIKKAEKMLQNVPQKPYFCQNSLEKLTLTLEDMHLKPPNLELLKLTFFGKNESMILWEQAFLNTVEWFTHFPEFNKLEMWVKIEILKVSWILWTQLEKFSETAKFWKRSMLGMDVFMCGNDHYVDMNSFEVDLTWCSNYSMDQLAFYVAPDVQNCRQYVQDLLNLNPTDTELNFMLSQLCLHNSGKKCQGKVLEATDKLIELQADSLHDYYVHKLKRPNYSARLTKLMKINQAIERDMFDRREKNHIARLFNIIAIDFSHPEMFDGQ